MHKIIYVVITGLTRTVPQFGKTNGILKKFKKSKTIKEIVYSTWTNESKLLSEDTKKHMKIIEISELGNRKHVSHPKNLALKLVATLRNMQMALEYIKIKENDLENVYVVSELCKSVKLKMFRVF